MKYLMAFILSIFFISTAAAVIITSERDEKHGINIPKYDIDISEESADLEGLMYLHFYALADSENFPISSERQGSIFLKIFDEFKKNAGIFVHLQYKPEEYNDMILNFERGGKKINAVFGVYYKDWPHSRNQYVYPAIMTNNVHLITAMQKKLDVTKKEDLKEYKGMYVSSERFSDLVTKELKAMNLQTAETFDQAYEELLTGKIDYILSGYYPSLLAAYSLGVRKYISYSKEPLWKMPVFIRYHESMKKDPRIAALSRYIASAQYKKKRDEVFQELVDIYKENTNGVVPPTYIKFADEETEETTENNEEEQTLEN